MALVAQGAEIAARRALAGFMPEAQLALVDGEIAIVVMRGGQLFRALRLTVIGSRATEIDVLADPKRLAPFEVTDLQ